MSTEMILAKYKISTNTPCIVTGYLHSILYLNLTKLYEKFIIVILTLQE